MMKTILKIVCVLMLVVNIANAQKDNSVNLTKDNQAKGIEDNYISTIGQVIEADVEQDLDFAMLYLQIIDNNSNDIYLTATSDDDNFDVLPRVSEDLIGKTVKAHYAKTVEREVVEYRPAQLPEGMANRGRVNVDPTITVYTIVGTQKFVSESVDGYEITFETENGVEMTFLADEMVFNGHSPIDFDGKEIKVSYIEFEDFNLKSLEILD